MENKDNDKKEKNQISLLEIKRKVQNEQEALKDDNKQKKFRILNYTSRDSAVGKIEKDFMVYFCFLCGFNCLISEIDIKKLPTRKTDNSIIFPFKKVIHKKFHKTQTERIVIKRKHGAEVQYRILCKECAAPIGYVNNLNEQNSFIYYYDYSLLKDQTKCKFFSDI
ncbi:conserved Plasmodium protein, unknown function [Plasmodium malariae]|uniref:STEEP1 domain-containing protein n=1 Tax=Plasmodium malariae TaxID=5858 RepID=A0A1C3L3I4_PLAMA|nr:conserved Plasmodium protein, unknown function [Plasmodium malariae]